MTTAFPSSIDQYVVRRDGIDPQAAANINNLQDAIAAVETELEDVWRPWHVGLLGWLCDPALISSQSQPASGVLQLVRVHKPSASPISAVVVGVQANGAGLGAGQCNAGVYSTQGVLLGQVPDQSAAWASGAPNMKIMPLTAVINPAPAGDYYVGWYAVGSTMPFFYRSGSIAIQAANMLQLGGLPIATTIATSAVALPQSTITLASVTGLVAPGWIWIVNDAGQKQIVWFTGIAGSQLTGCFGGSGTAQIGNVVTTPGARSAIANSALTTVLPNTLANVTPTNTGGQLWAALA